MTKIINNINVRFPYPQQYRQLPPPAPLQSYQDESVNNVHVDYYEPQSPQPQPPQPQYYEVKGDNKKITVDLNREVDVKSNLGFWLLALMFFGLIFTGFKN